MSISNMDVGVNLEVWSHDRRTGLYCLEDRRHNLLVNSGLELMSKALQGTEPSARLTHMEVGTGTREPTNADSSLQTPKEHGRVTLDLQGTTRTRNTVQYSSFFVNSSVPGVISEAGIYGGSEADTTVGSGLLFARSLISFSNVGGFKDLVLLWQVSVGRP